jgi:hypothetical protein
LQDWRWFQVCPPSYKTYSSNFWMYFMQWIRHSLCNATTNILIVYVFELYNLHACNSILELELEFLCCNHGDIWLNKQCCEYIDIWSQTIGW